MAALTIVRCATEEARHATSTATARQAAATIREVATECAERTRELLLLSRPHAASAGPIQLDAALCALAPKVTARLRGNVVCEVEAPVPFRHPRVAARILLAEDEDSVRRV